MHAPQRVLFLYNQDNAKEAADYGRGKVPSHRLFGLFELRQLGCDAQLCPMPAAPALLRKLLRRPLLWRVYQALFACFKGAHFDWIVATHEAAALPALVLKWMRLVRAPLVILNVALLHPKNRSGAR